MVNRNRINVVLLAGLTMAGMVLGGCGNRQVVRETKTEPYIKPSLEFRGIAFEEQSFDGMSVIFKFALIPKDKRPASIKACSYDFEFEGADTIHGKIKTPEQLASGAEIKLVSKLAIPWPKDKGKVMAFLERKRVPYKFKLQCGLDTIDGPLVLNGADAGTIPLPKLPQMDVNQANAERFGDGSEVRINFELSMLNENPFKIRLDKIVYKVLLDGSEVTKGQIPLAEIIPASAEFTYDVAPPIFISRDNKELLEMLSRPEIAYKLQGDVFLGKFKLLLDASGTISFPRSSQ